MALPIFRTLATALLVGSLAACASSGVPPQDPSEVSSSPADRLVTYRGALRELRANRFAAEAATDLDRAETSLKLAEARLGASDADSDKEGMDLLLETIRGRLVVVKSMYGKLAAEAVVETARAEYEASVRNAAEMAGRAGALSHRVGESSP